MRTRSWMGIVGGAAIALGAAACGLSNDAASSFNSGAGRDGSDAGNAATSFPSADSDAASPFLQDNAVLLVHAATAPAFRLCFEFARDLKPQPDATLMPSANVVGVAVGSAVRINPVVTTQPNGRVFLFSEPLIRAYYGPGLDEPTCGQLLDNPGIGNFAISLGTLDIDLSQGVHILAVTGCPGETQTAHYSKTECGATYSGASTLAYRHIEIKGQVRPSSSTIPAQVINLSLPVDIARNGRELDVAYGDLTEDAGAPAVLAQDPPFTNPAPAPSTPAQLPFDVSSAETFQNFGLRISFKDKDSGTTATLADQSLATITRLSSPRDVPSEYYSAASSYIFLLVGAPAPAYSDGGGVDPDELKGVHFIGVPVVGPKPDAGTTDSGITTPDGSTGP